MKKVVVFCSSSDEVSPMFFSDVKNLGKLIADYQLKLIYGGASVGLMGALANEVLSHGGHVKGIIPKSLYELEVAHEDLSELDIVSDMTDRKRVMLKDADIVLVYPGGMGTLDEAFEVLTLKQIGLFEKPIFFINTLDYWGGLFDTLTVMKQQKMISQDLDSLYGIFSDSSEVEKYFKQLVL